MSLRGWIGRRLGLERFVRVGGMPGGFLAYDAGRITRKDPDFLPRSMGPNALAEVGRLDLVRARARDLYDNNPIAGGAIDTIVDNEVGCGIWFEPDTGDDALNGQIQELLEWAARRVDPERQMGLWESQRLFRAETLNAGECGVYFASAEAFGEWPAMPAIELIDAERVALDLTGRNPGTGNQVRQGIEYDRLGRVVAYHVLTAHPNDGEFGGWGGALGGFAIGGAGVMRIAVGDMDMAFTSRRVNQLRGVPRTVTAMGVTRMEDGFQEDSMLQARTATAMGLVCKVKGMLDMFRKKRDGKLTQEQNLMIDAQGRPVERIEAGSVTFVQDGTEIQVINPNLPGPQFEPTIAALQRRLSRGFRVPYSDLSGDASRTTFSSMRGEQLAARKSYKPGAKFVWEHHTEPWRRRVIAWGVLTGRITITREQAARFAENPEALYRCNVQYPGWEYVNPAQESMANATDLESGVASIPGVCGELGRNWKRTIREQVSAMKFRQEEMARQGVKEMPGAGGDGDGGERDDTDPETGEERGGGGDRVRNLTQRRGGAEAMSRIRDPRPETRNPEPDRYRRLATLRDLAVLSAEEGDLR